MPYYFIAVFLQKQPFTGVNEVRDYIFVQQISIVASVFRQLWRILSHLKAQSPLRLKNILDNNFAYRTAVQSTIIFNNSFI